MDEFIRLFGLFNHIRKAPWLDRDFDLLKAYVCSELSLLVYGFVDRDERSFALSNPEYLRVMPCSLYQDMVEAGRSLSIGEIGRALDIGENIFLIEGKHVVIFGAKISQVIFIAIRGTAQAYDAAISLNAIRRREIPGCGHIHRGFFDLAMEHVDELLEKIKSIGGDNPLIYITGHSLGGAVAAILYGTWGVTGNPQQYIINTNPDIPLCCYTFGMPRYGSSELKARVRPAFHLQDERDFVPSSPPRWGYANSSIRYRLDGDVALSDPITGWDYARTLLDHIDKSKRTHSIENYRKKIATNLYIKGYRGHAWPV